MTAKSKTDLASDISSLFVENVTGDISATDVATQQTNLLDSIQGCYGALIYTGSTVSQSLNTSYAKYTAWNTNGVSDNITVAHTTDDMTVLIAGTYLVQFTAFISATSGHIFNFRFYLDGGANADYTSRFVAGTVSGQVSLTAIIAVTANQVLTVYGKSDQGGGSSLTTYEAQLIVTKIA